jgi:hypothetical protein
VQLTRFRYKSVNKYLYTIVSRMPMYTWLYFVVLEKFACTSICQCITPLTPLFMCIYQSRIIRLSLTTLTRKTVSNYSKVSSPITEPTNSPLDRIRSYRLSRPNWLPFYKLDPWFLATIFVVCLYLNNRSNPERLFLRYKRIILLVDSLCAWAIEAEKLRAALSASIPDLIFILGDFNY